MSEEKGEPTPTAPASVETGPDSPLTARLLSRGTDSLGLIDVRGAEQHYARIMDWLAARTPLLEHLRTRYGLTEGAGSTGLVFAEAFGPEGARAGDAGLNLSAAPVGYTAPAAEQIFTRVAHIPDDSDAAPAEARRIARRGVPTFSPAGREAAPGADAGQSRVEVVRQEQGEARSPALELALSNQEQPRDLQSPSPREEVTAATAEGRVPRPADAAQTSSPRPASNSARESTSPAAPRTMPSVEERPSNSTAEQDKTLARSGAASADAARSATARPIATDYEAPANISADENEPGRAAKTVARRVNDSPGTDALPLVTARRATGAAVVSEGQVMPLGHGAGREGAGSPTLTAAGVKLPVAGETRAPLPAETQRTLAQAREIRADDYARASASLQTQPLPLAASPAAERVETARRQSDSAPAVTRAASGVVESYTPGRTRPRARADEINVQRLTEQVSRHLARRLLVERERRGWGKK